MVSLKGQLDRTLIQAKKFNLCRNNEELKYGSSESVQACFPPKTTMPQHTLSLNFIIIETLKPVTFGCWRYYIRIDMSGLSQNLGQK